MAGFKRPRGFATPGTHRNIPTGTIVARGANPWGRPCPTCGAERYVRCFTTVAGKYDPRTDTTEGEYIYVKDEPHYARVAWSVSTPTREVPGE